MFLRNTLGYIFTSVPSLLCHQRWHWVTGMASSQWKTSCARGDTICPRPLYAGRCGRAAAHPLRLRHPACALLPVAVGTMNIHDVRNRRQTDWQTTDVVRRASSFNAPTCRGGGIIMLEQFSLILWEKRNNPRLPWKLKMRENHAFRHCTKKN